MARKRKGSKDEQSVETYKQRNELRVYVSDPIKAQLMRRCDMVERCSMSEGLRRALDLWLRCGVPKEPEPVIVEVAPTEPVRVVPPPPQLEPADAHILIAAMADFAAVRGCVDFAISRGSIQRYVMGQHSRLPAPVRLAKAAAIEAQVKRAHQLVTMLTEVAGSLQ